jgi:hypothetical protein
MAKMTRAEKRRRRTAKEVEMKLDGMVKTEHWRRMSYEELYNLHAAWKDRKLKPDYWGASLADMVINYQTTKNKVLLEELNGNPINTR